MVEPRISPIVPMGKPRHSELRHLFQMPQSGGDTGSGLKVLSPTGLKGIVGGRLPCTKASLHLALNTGRTALLNGGVALTSRDIGDVTAEGRLLLASIVQVCC